MLINWKRVYFQMLHHNQRNGDKKMDIHFNVALLLDQLKLIIPVDPFEWLVNHVVKQQTKIY